MKSARSRSTLERRLSPRQDRAARTVDAILEAAGRLLEEVGFEGMSTNKVCAAAGMTPPALYRYFPNKFALLKELGVRLMARQNAALEEAPFNPRTAEADLAETLRGQYEITQSTPGGAWIMRSLRATPMLAAVRLASHERAADMLTERFLADFPKQPRDALRRQARFSVEIGYAALEYLFDLAPPDREAAIRDAAKLLALHVQMLRAAPGP